ncbi:hypothetical protein W97_04994 [Coniosporium apollinis CBS 100218]|uniref:Uncharacterized protein n=1 Tax=Coniosporium apollinis (strain CBS 100218) TaxID=1168221 RepID=R7YUZ8_CONA1|nr:uncharacterized protein W97_04994 [Coniosporium apollinis CBS 100218]EON65755.1 hypothetical protein W97_04994 [Coniosporium apollinis CBS 100218]
MSEGRPSGVSCKEPPAARTEWKSGPTCQSIRKRQILRQNARDQKWKREDRASTVEVHSMLHTKRPDDRRASAPYAYGARGRPFKEYKIKFEERNLPVQPKRNRKRREQGVRPSVEDEQCAQLQNHTTCGNPNAANKADVLGAEVVEKPQCIRSRSPTETARESVPLVKEYAESKVVPSTGKKRAATEVADDESEVPHPQERSKAKIRRLETEVSELKETCTRIEQDGNRRVQELEITLERRIEDLLRAKQAEMASTTPKFPQAGIPQPIPHTSPRSKIPYQGQRSYSRHGIFAPPASQAPRRNTMQSAAPTAQAGQSYRSGLSQTNGSPVVRGAVQTASTSETSRPIPTGPRNKSHAYCRCINLHRDFLNTVAIPSIDTWPKAELQEYYRCIKQIANCKAHNKLGKACKKFMSGMQGREAFGAGAHRS